jgi:WD40 repeat protein/serine/threonine protein kinase
MLDRGSDGDTPARWQVGDVILGLYEILGVAGQGGMGIVYRVRHRRWDIELAVKCPGTEAFASERHRANFEREAHLWVDLGLHPNICTCHYVRRVGGIPRLFAEYAVGGSVAALVLDRRLYAGGRDVTLVRMLDVAIQAARGLAYAHAHDVIHQDVKPANVLLAADGEVKVTDFGIARAYVKASRVQKAKVDPRVSFGGMTPAYCSPEQARAFVGSGTRTLSPATDVWSLAVSVLELFMGRLPNTDGTAAGRELAAFRESGGGDPDIPALSEALADLLERCLRPDPGERPSMNEVAHELEMIYEQEAGAPYPNPTAEDTRLLAGELSNRALSMLDLGRPEEAESLWDQALAQDRHHPQATYDHGVYLWRAGRVTDAELVRRLDAVRGSHLADWNDEYLLALVHLERGDVEAARELLESAAAQAGQAPEVTAARELVLSAAEHARCTRMLASFETINGIALTADGNRALLADGHCTRLWDVRTGQCLQVFKDEADSVRSLAITPNGRFALTGGKDGTVRLWDIDRERMIRTLDARATVEAVALTRDARRAVTCARDGTARVWDIETATCAHLLEGHFGTITSVAVTADGRFATTVGFDGSLRLWELATGHCTRLVDAHRDWVWSVALTPDGRLALTGSQDKTARLWEMATGRCLQTLGGTAHYVTSVALTADGRMALTGGDDGCARLWEFPAGRCLRTLRAHDKRINSLALTPFGHRAATGSDDQTVRVWELRTEAPAPSAFAYARPRAAREASRAEARLREELNAVDRWLKRGDVAAAAERVRALRRQPGYERHPTILERWRTAGRQGQRTRLIAAWPAQVIHAHYAPPPPTSGATNWGAIDPDTRPYSHTQPGPSARIRAVAVTPDGRIAVSAAEDHNARVWDVGMGSSHYTLHHPDWVTAIALTMDGRLAVTGSQDGKIRVWEPGGVGLLEVLEGHESAVTSIAVTPDGRFVLTGSFDLTARLWDLNAARCLHTFEEQRDPVALTADGRTGLTTGKDHDVTVWDLTVGARVATLEHEDHVSGAALTSDGRTAATASKKPVRIWDIESGHCTQLLEGHLNYVQAVALTPDGRVALSGASDRTARVWDLAAGRCVQTLEGHADDVSAVALTADGHVVLTATSDGELRIWGLDWDYEFMVATSVEIDPPRN